MKASKNNSRLSIQPPHPSKTTYKKESEVNLNFFGHQIVKQNVVPYHLNFRTSTQ